MQPENRELNEPCPDLESLAALVDGRLESAERRRTVAHLDRCEACHEVFMETARTVVEEEREGGKVERLAPRRRWRAPLRWTAAAAALGAAATLVLAIGVLTRSDAGAAAEIEAVQAALADGPAAAEAAPREHAWSVLRSTNGARAGSSPRQRAFRLGVLSVDLDLAARSGDGARGARLAEEIAELVGPFKFSGPNVLEFEQLAATMAARPAAEETARWVRQATAGLVEAVGDEADLLLLGAWAEAGRVAAEVDDEEYFRRAVVRRLGRKLAAGDLPVPLVEPLREASAELPGGSAERLEAGFARLIAVGGNL